MTEELYVTRRHLLQTSSALGALATMAPLCSALASDEGEEIYRWALADVTPSTVPGPFYPLVNKPIDPDTDLTRSKGADERAKGQMLYLMGQELNIKGKPVKGVEVEIWQANAAGRYSHPSDGIRRRSIRTSRAMASQSPTQRDVTGSRPSRPVLIQWCQAGIVHHIFIST